MYSYSSDNNRAEVSSLFSESSVLLKQVLPHSFILPTIYLLPPKLNYTPFSQIYSKLRNLNRIEFFNINNNSYLNHCSFDCVGNSCSKTWRFKQGRSILIDVLLTLQLDQFIQASRIYSFRSFKVHLRKPKYRQAVILVGAPGTSCVVFVFFGKRFYCVNKTTLFMY